jgi:hypothetical protein
METYNILQGKKIVSTVNVNNIEHALEAAADFAAANEIQSELKIKIVEQILETTTTTETEK